MSFVEELTWRGLVHQSTDPELAAKMRAEPFTFYIGFDPSSDSLGIGNLVQILTLMRAQRAGHKPIALVGGATGMVGDPSGKSEERKLLTREDLQRNIECIRRQLSRFIDFDGGRAELVDNYEWFKGYAYLDFLRDVGKHFSVNMMIAKESVRARLEDRDQGISYTEFSYMLIQAYDFLVLHDRFGCKLQMGGSDQWGNITAGIELVRRLRGKEVFGLTTPLVVDSQGRKFGKSEKGNLWLDPARTSPYDFYQFLFRVDDRDVGRFLRYFTFLDEPAIAALEEQVRVAPEKREAQRVLARELTKLVHGAEALQHAESELPSTAMALPKPLVDVLVECGLCKSKSDARRQIEQGGVYVDGQRVDDVGYVLERGATLQRGKRDKHVITASG
ncbi:MAG: tyrosine--tRNA ligase [Polyangia bacterium]